MNAGPGETVAWPYFVDAADMPFAFLKRVLREGAGISLHLHDKDKV